MANVSRDVLIVSRLSGMSEVALEREYRQVTQLLNSVEGLQNACNVSEIHDVSRYKIVRKPHKVLEAFRKRQMGKPFVFLFNKN